LGTQRFCAIEIQAGEHALRAMICSAGATFAKALQRIIRRQKTPAKSGGTGSQ
jgi:hypothetical protein